jgi:hypothetical protein
MGSADAVHGLWLIAAHPHPIPRSTPSKRIEAKRAARIVMEPRLFIDSGEVRADGGRESIWVEPDVRDDPEKVVALVFCRTTA